MMRMTPFDEMDRLFEQMRRSMLELDGGIRGGFDDRKGATNVQLESHENEYVVHADLPGFEKEEIDLRFDDDVLTIHAEHVSEDEEGSRTRRVHETVRVSGPVVVEDVEASYHNGVLEVRLPTEADEETGRQIDIE